MEQEKRSWDSSGGGSQEATNRKLSDLNNRVRKLEDEKIPAKLDNLNTRAKNLEQNVHSHPPFGLQKNEIKEPEKRSTRSRTAQPSSSKDNDKKPTKPSTRRTPVASKEKEILVINRSNRNLATLATAGVLAGVFALGYGLRACTEDNNHDIYLVPGYKGEITEQSQAPSTPSTTPEPTQTPLATEKPSEMPSEEPTAMPTTTAVPELTSAPELELPLPIIGKPNYSYVLDGWYLIDGDIFVKSSIDGEYQTTYDDLPHTAQQTIAGPGVEITGLYGFSAYPLANETSDFNMNDESIRESMDTRIKAKLNEGYEIVDVDFIALDGELINVGTYTE